jgi:hypothetical protein
MEPFGKTFWIATIVILLGLDAGIHLTGSSSRSIWTVWNFAMICCSVGWLLA